MIKHAYVITYTQTLKFDNCLFYMHTRGIPGIPGIPGILLK